MSVETVAIAVIHAAMLGGPLVTWNLWSDNRDNVVV